MNLKESLKQAIINNNIEDFIMNNNIPNNNYKKILLVLAEIGTDIIKKSNDTKNIDEFFNGFEMFALGNEVVSSYITSQTGDFEIVRDLITVFYEENYNYQENTMGQTKAKVKVLSNGHSLIEKDNNKIVSFPKKTILEKAGFIGPLLLAVTAATIEVATVLYIIMK